MELQSRERSICSVMERVEMFAQVMWGKPTAGSPGSAAVLWKIETRWSRFPVVGRGERGAGVVFLGGPPCWEGMFEDGDTEARPNNEHVVCERRDCEQNDVVLRNVGGEKQGSGRVRVFRHFYLFFSFYF